MPIVALSQSSPEFDLYFSDHTMRIDYFHTGDNKQEFITIDKIFKQGPWAGNPKHLIDNFNNGRYYIKIFDTTSGKLIYSKGFDSYFGEYKTTTRAGKGIKKTFHETALIPYPKNTIRFTLEIRDRKNQLHSLFSKEIKPSSIEIIQESLITNVKVFPIIHNGDPHQKVDLVFIAEGYSSQEEDKVKNDFNRVSQIFFSQEPYKSYKNHFNISGIFFPSPESGCDEPRRGIYKKTAVDSTFNSLGSERYLLTESNKTLRDIAAHVPYDAVLIMINQKRYGGGGIYNFYCTFTIDNQWHPYLLLHEFGHSFAGLADEYYTSSVAYNDFYPRGIEPIEPNITALLETEELKWKHLVSKGIQIPTPWKKENFDKMSREYQKIRREINLEIAAKVRGGAPEIEKIKQRSNKLSLENSQKIAIYLNKSSFKGKIGAFMGAGYSSQGLYRPMIDCIMFTRGQKPYCTVCSEAIIRVIKHYSDQ